MTALLVVGHGTRSAAGVAQFAELLRLVAAQDRTLDVAGGFLELATPALSAGVRQLAERGAAQIGVVPLVLVAAGHAKGDIPGSLARERERHPGLRFRYGRPLGPHPTLVDLLDDRARAAGGQHADTALLLVGRGSTDPAANAEVALTARLLQEGRGWLFVETAFVSLTGPDVASGLERCRRLGARRVTVVPLFLFDGVLPDRVRAQAGRWGEAHPAVVVDCADVLGPSEPLAELVRERHREALTGDVRMSCDVCVHRVAFPGFAHKVGAPQTPHEHPDEPHPHAGEPPDLVPPAAAVPTLLRHHGDADLDPALLDAAVNVRAVAPPPWLAGVLAGTFPALGRYPQPDAARQAVAVRHGRHPDEVVLLAGAAEAFTLLARCLRPRAATVVHPQFTEPEVALRAAGYPVHRVLLSPTPPQPFALDPAAVDDAADLVVVGNPTNPTSVLHAADQLARLARPGRVLVVDEAFMDAVPGESESLAGRSDLPGLVVVRSLTKSWGLAGIRAGYLLAPPPLAAVLAAGQPAWPVSSPALAAITACCSADAVAEVAQWARRVGEERRRLARSLGAAPGLTVIAPAAAPFLLVHHPAGGQLCAAARRRGVALRTGATFPGLGPRWLRLAVREEPADNDAVAKVVTELAAAIRRTDAGAASASREGPR